jgi:hypothetical protein
MNVKSWYYNSVMDDFLDYVNDILEYDSDRSYEDVYDDLLMVSTGNDCGRRAGFNATMAHEIAFDRDFIDYVHSMDSTIDEIISKYGDEGIDCWAANFIMDTHYDNFAEEWKERCTQYNLGEY